MTLRWKGFPARDFSGLRPAYHVAAGLLTLQFLERLPDRQAVEMLRYSAGWKPAFSVSAPGAFIQRSWCTSRSVCWRVFVDDPCLRSFDGFVVCTSNAGPG